LNLSANNDENEKKNKIDNNLNFLFISLINI